MNKENENISFFLEAAEKYGVPRHNLFQTVDLAEGQNLAQVQTGLYNVSFNWYFSFGSDPVATTTARDNKQKDHALMRILAFFARARLCARNFFQFLVALEQL